MILSAPVSAWLWVLAALALAAYSLPALLRTHNTQAITWSWIAAWTTHGLILVLALLTGHFGFGPVISVTAWLVLTVYAVESRLYPQMQSRRILAVIGAGALIIGLVFPGAQMPVHASLWLPLHGALGVAAYGLLAVATLHAWLMRGADDQMRLARPSQGLALELPLLTLERLMFGFVLAAFVLLSATLLAGALFAEQLYGVGRAWAWNHKTIFSVLAWCLLAGLLWGRWQWGWRGKKAAGFVYGSALSLLLAYAGSRFVLEIVLNRHA